MKLLHRWNNLSSVAKSTIAFTFSSLLMKGIGFITVPVFTRILDSTQYGVVTVYNSWLSILEVFALLGLTSAGVFNVGLNEHRENRSSYVSAVLAICNIVTVFCFLLIGIGKQMFGSGFILSNSLLFAMFVHFLFSPAMTFWVSWERYEYRYKAAVTITVLYTLISQVATVLVILLSGNKTAEVKVWASVLSSLLFQFPVYVVLFKRGKNYFSKNIWKSVFVFAVPLLPHYLAQHVMASADKIMVTNLHSEEAAAIYAVTLNVGVIATIIWNTLNASLLPWIFERMNEKSYAKINCVTVPLLLIYVVLCVLLTLLAPEILGILAPNTYSAGIKAVPAVMGTAVMTALYNIYANVEFYHKKTSTIALATIIATIVNVTLNAALIPRFGFVGAAYATLCSYVALILIHFIGYCKCQKTRIYKDKTIFIISSIGVLGIEAVRSLYSTAFVRYSLIIVVILVFIRGIQYLRRKNICEL